MYGTLYFGTIDKFGLTYKSGKPDLYSLEYRKDGNLEFLSNCESISKDDLVEVLENVLVHLKQGEY